MPTALPPVPPPKLLRNEVDRLCWEAALRMMPHAIQAERDGRFERSLSGPTSLEENTKVACGLAVQMGGELVAAFLAARRPEI